MDCLVLRPSFGGVGEAFSFLNYLSFSIIDCIMRRKDFIKNSSLAAAALAILPSAGLFTDSKVKIGLIGTGLRGQDHLDLLLRRDDVEVVAICDVEDRMLTMAREVVAKSG